MKRFNKRFLHYFFRDYFFATICVIVISVGWPLSLIEWPEKYGKEDLQLPKGYDSDKFFPDGTTDRLLTFVQLTDIHLGFDLRTKIKFERYLSNHLPIINPNFHVVTGDITDGINRKQHEEDWVLYKQMLAKYHITKDVWFDVQGNHDMYGVLKRTDEDNYYYKHTIHHEKLKDWPQAYKFSYKAHFGTYDFLALNTLFDPVPEDPYGLFGIDSTEILDRVEDLINTMKTNQTFIISHYPIQTNLYTHKTSKTKKTMRHILRDERVFGYLGGHLHHYENNMHKLDSKIRILHSCAKALKSRFYKIFSIDNDLVNFVGTRLGEWPKILPTNPKNALFISKNEPLDRIRKSTHIRALIYQNPARSQIKSVKVKIDGKTIGNMTRPKEDSVHPLWVLSWDPKKYEEQDLHVIKYIIYFQDDNKKPLQKEHKFSVVGKQQYIKLKLNRDFNLRTDWNRSRKPIFWIGYGMILVRLFLFSKILISLFSKTFLAEFQNELLQTLDEDKYNLLKAVILHFKVTFWRHSQLSNRYWGCLCVLAVFSVALPSMIFKVANNKAWVVIWVFGGCVEGRCSEYAKSYIFGIIFTYIVLLPAIELIVDLEIANKTIAPEYMTIRYIAFRSLEHIIVFLIGYTDIIESYKFKIGPTGYLLSIGHIYVGLLLLMLSSYLLIKWYKKIKRKNNQPLISL
ncbi:transmembrane protein [Anaeramoeba flamelloides]|uniref:Transmembrane protein n=1 Tax=Anaeramoeba flamelloides TaxID=1746091 RepID=A0AAV7YUV5_9EUKA|nr:transmembrane protein [Anaeramoeba flamelloides]